MHNLPWQEAKLFIRNDDTNIEKVNIKLDLMESANGVVRKKENLHLVQVFLLRMRMVNIEKFINQYVTKRSESMFAQDINANEERLKEGIDGKNILVIGGAGSIGSSFIKTILHYTPKSLVVVDVNENALAELTRDLRTDPNLKVPEDYVTYPMDYSSKVFEKMFRKRCGFDIVANFSAHKHVRSEKDIYSVEALLRNNLFNAKKLLDLLTEYPPEHFFCVSTDKAANPVNIMGASKRIMEDLIFVYSDEFPVTTARFANVAFSNGSLPAGFIERMRKEQPISAPKDVKRFFVSPEESGQICVLACILGKNREIFFPKLDTTQMMSFDKIAEHFIEENGYRVLQCESDEEAIRNAEALRSGVIDYPVHFSMSDTSGEKPYEEFYTDEEIVNKREYQALGVVEDKPMPDRNRMIGLFNALEETFEQTDATKEDIVRLMQGYLPNFEHLETGKNLDSKM